MAIESQNKNSFWHLALSAVTGAILVAGSLFGGWFLSFIIMRFVGKSLLVGMNYLAWPIVFPIMVFPVAFLLFFFTIPLYRHPYRNILENRWFLFGELLPILFIALALMFATCPLDIGGTLLTRGWEAFG